MVDPTGRPTTHSFAVGDGIEHLRCAPDGTVWVGYFDEGIFGETLGAGGIVQFNSQGVPQWSYNDHARGGQSYVDDCYAMSLDGAELWTSFYSDFPIVRIRDGHEKLWRSEITGAKALALEGDFVVLAGGYNPDENRIALLELTDGTAKLLGSYNDSALQGAALIQGRSNVVHVVNDRTWRRVSVAEVRARLDA
jgi:hypothetical protein